ncbi:alpha-amylase family glycosyl hydrolase [Fredinandcohnia sp. 179-A 10B2 NHS]|uniref:alpha-amylase family glycosyl hydrolase n=1 Tax=Fredinandcohnia sp. 179-A 10B2 NHS TaxID=3235176 RepID=UPI0039A3B19F
MQKQVIGLMLLTLLLFSAFPVHADQVEERSFEEESIYFIMVDRFNNGDTSNDADVDHTNPVAYQGGDLKGITDKLDYIKEMGFTSILLTPIFNNGADGYNGYNIENYTELEEHFGTIEDLKELTTQAHKKNMKVILDLGLRSVNGTPLNQGEMLEVAQKWIQEADIDGYKLDITDGMEEGVIAKLSESVKTVKENFIVIGQQAGKVETHLSQFKDAGVDLFFNNLLYQGVTSFSIPNQGFENLEANWDQLSQDYKNPNRLLTFMDNQDTMRFTYLSTEENEHPAPRIKLGLTYMYTAPGIPIVYYGTEIALNGAEPPANSGLMDFRTDQELVEYITLLSKVRTSIPALTKGTFEVIANEGGMLLFKREYEGETAYVAINNTLKAQKFTFSSEQIGKDKELKGLLTEDLVRPVDDEFNVVVERDAAEVYLVQNSTKINYSLFLAVFIVPLLMIGFIYLNKKRHGNNPKPE